MDSINYCEECEKEHRKQVRELKEQLKRKEQECEELKNFHINLVGVKECDIRELLKLKQTLTEIKEIADKDFRHTAWEEYAKQLKQILQKCEVIDV